MTIVVFGLSISSAWGNGHATLLRGLFRSLHAAGHTVHFFERDAPYYAQHRDSSSFSYVHLHIYNDWGTIASRARSLLSRADAAIVTSYCPDARPASALLFDAQIPRTLFYDMDTPVTFSRLYKGEDVPYLPERGLADFDLVLSYTGGRAIKELKTRLHAREVAPLYGWVDPEHYFPVSASNTFRADLSYLGTYSEDRQPALETLFIAPARESPSRSFSIGGAMYPAVASWPPNVRHFDHVAPREHPAFYCSSPVTLNITRASMAAMGYCPSGRLFEAAACGAVILSDSWEGLNEFFEPGEEILLARTTGDSLQALSLDGAELARIARRARERALSCHTAQIRARRLLSLIESPVSDANVSPAAAIGGNETELATKGA